MPNRPARPAEFTPHARNNPSFQNAPPQRARTPTNTALLCRFPAKELAWAGTVSPSGPREWLANGGDHEPAFRRSHGQVHSHLIRRTVAENGPCQGIGVGSDRLSERSASAPASSAPPRFIVPADSPRYDTIFPISLNKSRLFPSKETSTSPRRRTRHLPHHSETPHHVMLLPDRTARIQALRT